MVKLSEFGAFLRREVRRAFLDREGVSTIDWVVLTAACAALAMGTAGSMLDELQEISDLTFSHARDGMEGME